MVSKSFKVDPKRCQQDYVSYDKVLEWFKDKNGKKTKKIKSWQNLDALKSDEPGYVQLWTEKYNHFETKKTKIKKNWVLDKKTGKFYDQFRENNICGSRKPLSKKAIPSHLKGFKSYLIHDNGARPFLVFVKGQKELHIYKVPSDVTINLDDKLVKENYHQLVKSYKTKKIWIGKHTIPDSYWNPKKSAGNTILAYLGGSRYLSIGFIIHEFETPQKDKITKYYSMIGNNDVPYPVALGEKFIYYDNDSYLPQKAFEEWKMTNNDWESSSLIYHGHHETRKLDPKYKSKKVPKIKIIHSRIE